MRLTDEERTRIAEEVEAYLARKYPWIKDGNTCIHSIAAWLRRGYVPMFGVRSLYWLMVNEWDKMRGDTELHPIILQVPEIRKFFWELHDQAVQLEWERKTAEYADLLAPYTDQREEDLAIQV